MSWYILVLVVLGLVLLAAYPLITRRSRPASPDDQPEVTGGDPPPPGGPRSEQP